MCLQSEPSDSPRSRSNLCLIAMISTPFSTRYLLREMNPPGIMLCSYGRHIHPPEGIACTSKKQSAENKYIKSLLVRRDIDLIPDEKLNSKRCN